VSHQNTEPKYAIASHANQSQPDSNRHYLARSQRFQQLKSGDIIKLGGLSEHEKLIPSITDRGHFLL